MAKYIIEIPDEVPVSDELVPFDMCRPSWYLEAYEKGKADTEDDVWEFIRIICDMTVSERKECFSSETCDLDEYLTYQEAKTKYDAWKKSKEEVRVGDEVVYHGNKYVVGYVGADEVYHIVDKNWIREVVQGRFQLIKTGHHFPEVAELLKKMREK